MHGHDDFLAMRRSCKVQTAQRMRGFRMANLSTAHPSILIDLSAAGKVPTR